MPSPSPPIPQVAPEDEDPARTLQRAAMHARSQRPLHCPSPFPMRWNVWYVLIGLRLRFCCVRRHHGNTPPWPPLGRV
jgi:hypothetical protein